MKIFKYLLFLVLGLILIFVAVGLFTPVVDYGHEIKVKKPIAEAWAVTQDESKYAQWLEGFKSIELLSGEKGTVGSTYKVIVNPGEGQDDFEMTETVVSLKEHDHVEMKFDSEMMDFEQRMSFAVEGGGTRIWTESKVLGKNVMMRAMFALMEGLGGAFETQEAKNMEALKVLIDENQTVY
jgi:carbon monoxide dehydrogenase subunit G